MNIRNISKIAAVATAIFASAGALTASVSTANAAQVLYGLDFSTQTLMTIDTSSGVSTPIGVSTVRNGLAYDGLSDILYGGQLSGSQILHIVNPTDASTTLVGNSGVTLTAMSFNADFSKLYGIEFNSSGRLYEIDTGTGLASLIGNTGLSNPSSLAINSNNEAYVLDTFGGSLHSVNLSDASVSTIASVSDGITSAAFDENDILYGITLSSDDLVTVDTSSGAFTTIGNVGFVDVRGLTFAFEASAQVGEPGMLAVFALGLAGLGAMRRRIYGSSQQSA